MNAKEIINRLGGVSEEVLKEALQCQTEDELLALADRKGVELTEGEATLAAFPGRGNVLGTA